MRKTKNLLSWLYIIAVFFVVPLYNEGTFDNITQRKVVAYQTICGLALFLYFMISMVQDIASKQIAEDKQSGEKTIITPTDILMVMFVCSVALSTLFSSFKKEAIYGTPGFGMGLLTIGLMAFSYILISRNLICDEKLLYLITLSSVIPAILVIVNRLGFDPLRMYEQGANITNHLYVSTFANYSWYNEYMAIIAPISLYMFFAAKKLLIKILYALHLVLCATAWVMAGTITFVLATTAVICAIVAWNHVTARGVKLSPLTVTAIFLMGIIAYLLVLIYAIRHDSFANGRGYIWRLSVSLFKSFDIKEIFFGVGPNCFTYALNEFLFTDQYLLTEFESHFNGLALTSAHSEYLDYLIGTGIIGTAIYIIMLTAFVISFVKKDITSHIQRAAMLSIISYLVYSMFYFSVIVATPMFFIMLGMSQSVTSPVTHQ